jgi:hypothetical protein
MKARKLARLWQIYQNFKLKKKYACLNKLVMFQYSLRRCQETAVTPACEEIHKIFKFTNDTLYAKTPHSHGKYLNLPILLCTQLSQSIYYKNIRYILVLNPVQPKFR